MTPGPRLGLLLVVLAASLGLKLALFRPDTLAAETLRRAEAGRRAAALLDRAGLRTTISPADPSIVTGTGGTCSVVVMAVSAEGWQSAAIERLATENSRVFFVHGDEVHDRQPTGATWLQRHQSRLVRYLGVEPPHDPVFGVVQTPGCQDYPVSWAGLGDQQDGR